MPALPDITTHTPFRIAEKHFKNRSVPNVYPSLRKTSILDLSRPAGETDDVVWQAGWWGPDSETGRRLKKGKARARGERPEQDLAGLKRVELADGKVGWLVKEGCILIPGYLSAEQQLDIAEAALSRYTLPPNPLSLSPHWDLPTDLFSTYSTAPETLVHPLHQSRVKSDDHASQSNSTAPGDTVRQMIDTDPAAVVDYAEILAKTKTSVDIAPSDKLKPKTANDLVKELRWANLGWVYQWTTKAYDFSPPEPIEFPTEMANLCTDVVRSIPWPEVFADVSHADKSKRPEWSTWGDDYRPDTGIVNFYQMSDTLMGHVDRAELDPSRPLVSVSLGHACIFLLGSSSRQDPPQPVILRSGDVLVMSGTGRQSYHGVPRIMEGTLPAHFLPQSTDTETTSAVKRFISTARINMNARQVFPPGFERPP